MYVAMSEFWIRAQTGFLALLYSFIRKDDCTEALVQPDVIHTESAVHAADNPPG